ncbi:MAG TPA: hypothetical protein VFU55_06220, partial [Terracidiphilus sp.]|nr:hypothetical protein [Terracidiphilus sp.]
QQLWFRYSRRAGKGLDLLLAPDQVFHLWLVLGLASRARRIVNHARGFGLPHTLARIGLDRLGGGEPGWLAFPHLWDEYGII